jgi:hypothetical protein
VAWSLACPSAPPAPGSSRLAQSRLELRPRPVPRTDASTCTRQAGGQRAPRRRPPNVKEVGLAIAVRRAKVGMRDPESAPVGERPGPDVLELPGTGRAPRAQERGALVQIVDMPPRSNDRAQVMAQATREAARTEGASQVEQMPRIEPNGAECTDHERDRLRTREDERVGPGKVEHALRRAICGHLPRRPLFRSPAQDASRKSGSQALATCSTCR